MADDTTAGTGAGNFKSAGSREYDPRFLVKTEIGPRYRCAAEGCNNPAPFIAVDDQGNAVWHCAAHDPEHIERRAAAQAKKELAQRIKDRNDWLIKASLDYVNDNNRATNDETWRALLNAAAEYETERNRQQAVTEPVQSEAAPAS